MDAGALVIIYMISIMLLFFGERKKAPARRPIKINKPGLQTLWILTLRNYAIYFSPHGTPWHIWSRMQRIRGSNHRYFPIKAFCIYVCLQKNPSSKSPEMVDAPEFSQAHLYRLVNMVAGAGFEPTAFGLWVDALAFILVEHRGKSLGIAMNYIK